MLAPTRGPVRDKVGLDCQMPMSAKGHERLHDRGEIAVGKRADLIRVHVVNDVAAVRSVWRIGRRVA